MFYIDGQYLISNMDRRAPAAERIQELARNLVPVPMRVNWYDGKAGKDSPLVGQQDHLRWYERTPGIRLRLGRLVHRDNPSSLIHAFREALNKVAAHYEIDPDEFAGVMSAHWSFRPIALQKEVDTLLTIDLLASRGPVYLTSGDRDFGPALDLILDRGQHLTLVLPQNAPVPVKLRARADRILTFDTTAEYWRAL